MAVHTQSINVYHQKNIKTWPARPHDYLYDPCCILSSEKDHATQATKALKSTCDQTFLPVYRRMFSELPNYPAGVVQFQDRRPIPWFISRRYRTIGTGTTKEDIHANKNEISGPELFKFFRKPAKMNLLSNQMAAWVYKLKESSVTPRSDLMADEATMCNQSTQTDYRESEAQTDPYSPLFRIIGCSEPEILTLASLTWGNGLPVGEAQLVMIERARIKRDLEASLPSLTKENLEKRLRLIAKIEWNEWLYRDKQIQELHDIKLSLMKEIIKSENNIYIKTSTEKLTRLWRIKQNEKEVQQQVLEKINFRETHKLVEKRRALGRLFVKHNQVDPYLDPSSEVYAPLLRNGIVPPRCKRSSAIKCKYMQTPSDILYLEKFLPEKHFRVQCDLPKLPDLPSSGYIKRKYKGMKLLDDAFHAMKHDRRWTADQKFKKSSMGLMEKLEKPPTRPITPEIKGRSKEEEQTELSAIIIQKILRGRAIQLMMHEGKERFIDLIQELRSSNSLYLQEQEMIDKAKAELQAETDNQMKNNKIEEDLQEVIQSFAGDGIAQMLDCLSKELIRLQDERRIHALAMLAERQRRIREAEESGLRQVEERRRREEQEIFRELLNVHQKSIDGYLEDVILAGVSKAAHNQARYEIEAMAQKINNAAHAFEERRSSIQNEEMVAELIHSFLLPEIERNTVRENVRRKQHAALNAAHEFIYIDSKPPTSFHSAKLDRKVGLEQILSKSHTPTPPRKSARIRKSTFSLDDWHRAESLENWDIFVSGQAKYYQQRMIGEWSELQDAMAEPEEPLEVPETTGVFSRSHISSEPGMESSSMTSLNLVFGPHAGRKKTY